MQGRIFSPSDHSTTGSTQLSRFFFTSSAWLSLKTWSEKLPNTVGDFRAAALIPHVLKLLRSSGCSITPPCPDLPATNTNTKKLMVAFRKQRNRWTQSALEEQRFTDWVLGLCIGKNLPDRYESCSDWIYCETVSRTVNCNFEIKCWEKETPLLNKM